MRQMSNLVQNMTGVDEKIEKKEKAHVPSLASLSALGGRTRRASVHGTSSVGFGQGFEGGSSSGGGSSSSLGPPRPATPGSPTTPGSPGSHHSHGGGGPEEMVESSVHIEDIADEDDALEFAANVSPITCITRSRASNQC